MGSRGNVVVVRDGNWSLYTSNYVAQYLDTILLFGPELATREIVDDCEEADRDTGWLDINWCEGAAIIDHDRQVLLWFGGEDIQSDVFRRQAWMELARTTWADWEVRWAPDGLVEVGAYVGLPAAKFSVPREPIVGPDGISGYTDSWNYGAVLLTVRANGSVSARQDLDLDGIYKLEWWPKRLEEVLSVPREDVLHWQGDPPQCGVHIDVDARRLLYWLCGGWGDSPAPHEKVRAAWADWQVVWLGDRFEEQLQLAGVEVRFSAPPMKDRKREILDYTARVIGPAPDVARSDVLAKLIAENDQE